VATGQNKKQDFGRRELLNTAKISCNKLKQHADKDWRSGIPSGPENTDGVVLHAALQVLTKEFYEELKVLLLKATEDHATMLRFEEQWKFVQTEGKDELASKMQDGNATMIECRIADYERNGQRDDTQAATKRMQAY
jgi:hypothetical protein